MIALLKGLHVAALSIWCAGLVALPVLLQIYGRRAEIHTQPGFSEFRLLIHATYTRLVTPAAVVAIAAGTALILALGLREPWLVAKLAAVAGMVLAHCWLGHLIVQTAEGRGTYRMPPPMIALPVVLAAMGAVLWLVLAKPELGPLLDGLPAWLRRPQDRPLPSVLTPI